MSCTAATLKEQLESKIHAAATSTAETAEIRTHNAIEGVRRDVQATISQNLVDAHQCEEKAQAEIVRLSTQLERLMQQLNQYKPVSKAEVSTGQKQLSIVVDVRLQLQSQRIDNLNATVQKGTD